jgi:NAD(P)-dependent dehydrogenase (short-subunit alcohol dehydrogenase family)
MFTLGCASGIGLATTELLLNLGAFVVGSDVNVSSTKHPNFTFVQTNVTKWTDLLALFKAAVVRHGQIDHVYANAGISNRANYLEDRFDANGDLLEPDHLVFDINLRAVVNTTYLALHYLKKNPNGGSIVLIGSASSFQRFRVVDYVAAKHGVLGLMRGLHPVLESAKLPIRINTIAPSWTISGLVPEIIASAGKATQDPEVVARKVAYLMADETRKGQLIYSHDGKYKEIEESVLLKAVDDQILNGEISDDEVVKRMYNMIQSAGAQQKAAP